jgi:hypothetical protein
MFMFLFQLQRVCPGLCRRVLAHIVEMVAEEIARLMSCVASYSEEGAMQAHVDLAFLRKSLDHYSTPTARFVTQQSLIGPITSSMFFYCRAFFNEALDAVPALKSSAQKK